MPKISVIVPVYKVEPYLSRCVDSILGQSFTDFELILVDDGSPDRCPSMCDEYAQKDSRVHVIHQKNGGLSAARNAGIDWVFANSDSEWLNFVDSDDWMHPEALECLWNAVKTSHTRIAAFGYQETSGNIEEPEKESFEAILRTPEEFYIHQNVTATIACAKLYQKECFKSIRYPIGKIHEDEFVTYRLLFAEKYIAVMEAQLYFYFRNADGIIHSAWKPAKLASIEAKIQQLEFFENKYDKAYKKIAKSYIFLMANHIQQIQQSTRVDYQPYLKKTRKNLRKGLAKYGRLVGVDFVTHKYIYQIAYPKAMNLYWRIQAIKAKVTQRVK